MEIDEAAVRLDAVATRLAGPGGRVALLDPGPTAFGAGGPGEFGVLGRALAGLCADALAGRDHEAARVASSAAALATALRDSAAGFHHTDASARGRIGGS